jgi:hypothetical protein
VRPVRAALADLRGRRTPLLVILLIVNSEDRQF